MEEAQRDCLVADAFMQEGVRLQQLVVWSGRIAKVRPIMLKLEQQRPQYAPPYFVPLLCIILLLFFIKRVRLWQISARSDRVAQARPIIFRWAQRLPLLSPPEQLARPLPPPPLHTPLHHLHKKETNAQHPIC